ncbi:hypothetical protein [Pelagibacterium sp.]|uniref:hypothetical protein n=1 Tax=Pelagibacterium sp. TaxID=1967288 RepID=UPI003A9585A1
MNFLPDLSFQRLVYQLFAAIVVLTAHGVFLALGARLLGDRGPQYDGRLGLNPFSQTDPIGALVMIATQLGWVRPVTLDPGVMIAKRFGPLLVTALALLGTIALGWCCWQLRPLAYSVLGGGSAGVTVIGLLEVTAGASLAFVIINLIPILPLSAGHLWMGLGPSIASAVHRFRMPISIVLALAILAGIGPYVRGLVVGPLSGFFG